MNSHWFLDSSIDIKPYDQPLRELLGLGAHDLHEAEKLFYQIIAVCNCVRPARCRAGFNPALHRAIARSHASENRYKCQKWRLTHLLIPMHAKIRLSFAELQAVAAKVVGHLEEALRVVGEKSGQQFSDSIFKLQIKIVQAHRYHESLFLGSTKLSLLSIERFNQSVTLSKYVGLVQVEHSAIGKLDIVVDTTSPFKNLHCLVIVAREVSPDSLNTPLLVEYLAGKYHCQAIA